MVIMNFVKTASISGDAGSDSDESFLNQLDLLPEPQAILDITSESDSSGTNVVSISDDCQVDHDTYLLAHKTRSHIQFVRRTNPRQRGSDSDSDESFLNQLDLLPEPQASVSDSSGSNVVSISDD